MTADFVLDTGALAALQRDRKRLLALLDLSSEESRKLRTTAPVVTEFLGHSPRGRRAAGEHVLSHLAVASVEGARARRAAALIHSVLDAGGRARPSAIDALVTAEAEATAAAVVFDGDRADFEALAEASGAVELRELEDLV